MPHNRLEPKLLTCLREGIPRAQLARDAGAGLIVGVIAVPLAIAFGIASGVKPEQGLITAVVAGLLISLLGGSRVQIGGPTGAFIVLVYDTVHRFGYEGLAVATLLAGGLMVALGLARLGSVIRYIPYPVTVGFTSGIAVIILVGQIGDFLGLAAGEVPAELAGKLAAYARALPTVEPWAVAIGAGTVAVVALWPRVTYRLPGSLVALVATTVAVHLFDLPVATIGDRFGEVSASLPRPALPRVDWAIVPQLIPSAVAIALLGGIESLLSAVVADGMTGRRHRSNMELVAQGAANLIAPLFGGIPATGAIARTAANVKNGGRTPVAGMVHALAVLAVMLFFGKWAALVPMATLSGILMVVAYHMSEWHLFVGFVKAPRSDLLVALTTFGLTVFADLVVAIEVGVVLSALLFMRRMARMTEVTELERMVEEDGEEEPEGERLRRRDVPAGIEVYEVDGPFFFGAAEQFKSALARVDERIEVLVLRLRRVPMIDATGIRALEELHARCRRERTLLVLSGLQPRVGAALVRAGLLDAVGAKNVVPDVATALDRGRAHLAAGRGAGSDSAE